MTDNRRTARRVLAGFEARLDMVEAGRDVVALWQVDDLERHVDRRALLAGDDAPEPPYWPNPWGGPAVLPPACHQSPGRRGELGGGLGLPGPVAAARGPAVPFMNGI